VFELLGVSKQFGATVALAPLDLRVEPSQTLVLIGTSGSGKSTLLRLLIGLETPDTGEVRFEGAPVRPAQAAALRRRLGYVIQGGGLFPHLTARQNVTLLARHLGWDEARLDARVAALAELVQLPKALLDRYPLQLSGGQAQRVSLMRGLMADPQVLLLDEPLGALDPITRYELQADLRNIFNALRKTVVMVTHDLGEAAFFADRILLMREGRVVQDGTFADLVERPAEPFVTQFVRAQHAPAEART
jgi:osmoprotectant transport system ATP-binding protein